ncbi:GntR family transcriptional regulator [Evansella halocellulosilytica]|uniref:GntR family transcriptional regulator n=1 Tax=Evansella halocellulosilytica TaxID=2011013 RepID=UPI000BB88028|nr:GntR family transcriptional regulator [Evansella halocellulosilytica]
MLFEKLTLSQKIADHIATQIVEGKLEPGQRLLEQELKDIFGTSRAPIREALFLLENQGVVERVPRKGVFVKKYSRKEILDFYDIVYRLTEIALKKGVINRSTEQINYLFEIIEEMENSIKDEELKKCFLLVEKLHMFLFELPNNLVLKDLYEKLNKRWTTFRYLTLSHPDSLSQSICEYKEIIIGLRDQDEEKILKVLSKKEKRALAILERILVEQNN